MIRWFYASAPIRSKMNIWNALNAIAAGALAASGMVTASYAGESLWVELLPLGPFSALVLIGFVAKRLICDPYVNTVVRMEALAAGDLDSPIRYTDHTDCVGRLTKAMDVFRANASELRASDVVLRIVMPELGGGVARLFEGDLTHRMSQSFGASHDSLREKYNDAIGQIESTLQFAARSAKNVQSGATEVRSASDDLSRRTEQQAASLEQTAAAMDEITAAVRKAADDAQRANQFVTEARSEAEQSGTVVRSAVEAMAGIERASVEISEIISVIEGIAFQTNLLALNAGVEAARAGDAGKGFAVVASEVRALAQRSTDAAQDVKSRILASSQQVNAGVALVSRTGTALECITDRMEEIDGLVSSLAAAAAQQASAIQEVNSAVSEMDSVTQQNAAMVEQATAAARSLATEADDLARQIARFKTTQHVDATRNVVAPPLHSMAGRAAKASRRPAAIRHRNTALAVQADDEWSQF